MALPRAHPDADGDTLTAHLAGAPGHGSSGDDTLGGEAGDDRLLGRLGADALEGDEGNDSLSGGAAEPLLLQREHGHRHC